KPGVPTDSGTPLQLATLASPKPDGSLGALVQYVLVPPIGIEAVDVIAAFDASSTHAPNAVLKSDIEGVDFLDVGVVKNRVVAIEQDRQTGSSQLGVFTAELKDVKTVPLPVAAARVGSVENFVLDLNGDGAITRDELFDVAIVSSGQLASGAGC